MFSDEEEAAERLEEEEEEEREEGEMPSAIKSLSNFSIVSFFFSLPTFSIRCIFPSRSQMIRSAKYFNDTSCVTITNVIPFSTFAFVKSFITMAVFTVSKSPLHPPILFVIYFILFYFILLNDKIETEEERDNKNDNKG